MQFKRFPNNPVLGPDRDHVWEAQAVFNSSIAKKDDVYHMVYRALSYEKEHEGEMMEVSVVGHTSSTDSKAFNGKRKPFIVPEREWEKFGCEDPRVTQIGDTYYILYTALSDYPHSSEGIKVAVATTKDFETIEEKHLVTHFNSKAMALFPDTVNGKYVAILTVNTDNPPVRIAIAEFDNIEQLWDRDFWTQWYENLDSYTLHFQRSLQDHIEVGAAPVKTDEGWLLLYSYIRGYQSGNPTFGIDAALLGLDNPLHVVGRTAHPVLVPQETYELHGMIPNITFPSGVWLEDDVLTLHYGAADNACCIAQAPLNDVLNHVRHKTCDFFALEDKAPVQLERFEGNPIIEPDPEHAWESKYTLNPTAIYDEDKVHILYRGQDKDDTSYVGYATSKDGLRIDEKLSEPIYVPRASEEVREEPGNSGCEDARITKLSNRFYMCYTAYNGYGPARVALTSISQDDFRNRRWDAWDMPKMISVETEYDKNACLVSEKVNGQYIFFHRLHNSIWIDRVDDLDFEHGRKLRGDILMTPIVDSWDSEKIGIAGPPIKVGDDWVLIYHSLSKHDGMYRLGAALLDLEKGKVLARLPYPILTPEAEYENSGLRPGTVFSCGQVVINDRLYVYYGGADQYVGVAVTDFQCLVEELQNARL